MSLIALRTSAGKYLHSATGPFLSMGDAPVLLKLVQLANDQVMLQVPDSGHYVTVMPDGVSTSADPGPQCMLRVSAQDDGAIAFLAPDGVHYLSATNGDTVAADATAIGEHERFYMEVQSLQGCCGTQSVEPGPGIQWEYAAHRRILERATELLEGLRSLPDVKRFIETFWANPTFRNYAFQGLVDADRKSPWKDGGWQSHFYNPRNGRNYNESHERTAQSEGRRYFGLSEHLGQRIFRLKDEAGGAGNILYKHAGYYLGLSMHFLTDLTQPMHAANFTNVWGFEGRSLLNLYDRRHAGFEIFADDAVRHYKLLEDLAPLQEYDIRMFTDSGGYLDDVAREANAVFHGPLKNVLEKKEVEYYEGVRIPLYCENFWRADEAVPALRASLRLAPLRVARYLVNWARRVAMDLNLNSDTWYSILEPTRAPANPEELDKYHVAGMMGNGEVVRWSWQAHDYTQMWSLHFNADGTVCIGSRHWKNSIWLMYEARNKWWVGHGKDAAERRSRFRIIPHDSNRVWILEPTLNEAVTVKSEEENQGSFWRKDPSAPREQAFRLRALGPISTTERTDIQYHYPRFGDYKWWGARDTVPEWERGLGD